MTPPRDPWATVTAARLPPAGLAALAAVRDRPGVRVHAGESDVWVTFPAGAADVVRCLRPAVGVSFVRRDGDLWFRVGSRLPTAGPPAGEGRPLAAVLVPERIEPAPPGGAVPPLAIRLVRGGEPKPASAMLTTLADLSRWADAATTLELAAVRGAVNGGRAALIGHLPPIAGERFWGESLFVPVGFRPDPDLPPATLRAAIGAAADECVFLTAAGADVIPKSAFAPLTRAGVRLACRRGPT